MNKLSPQPFYEKVNDPELRALARLLYKRMTPGDAGSKFSIIHDLKDMMQDDIVHFMYSKASGEDRFAFGTRCPELIQKYHGSPKEERTKSSEPTTFNYFDLQRRAWRSFRPENIIYVDKNYTI